MKQLITIALIMVLSSGIASAAPEDKGTYSMLPQYAAFENALLQVQPSARMIEEAPKAYFRVYGVWPETFAQIHEAGLIRDNLSLDGQKAITPDDGPPQDFNDIQYVYRGPSQAPQILHYAVNVKYSDAAIAAGLDQFVPGTGVYMDLPGLGANDTYSWAGANRNYEQPDHAYITRSRELYGNTAVHKLLAVASLCYTGAIEYRKHTGYIPQSWKEFVDTGFCPVTSDMLNPVTGKPYVADGSTYSVDFHPWTLDSLTYRSHDMHGNVEILSTDGMFSVRVLGEDGDVILAW
jgi:hypothetical protein